MEQSPTQAAIDAPIWAVSDGRAGNARQAEALAVALAGAGAVECLTLSPRAPWRWFAPRRLPAAGAAFGAGFAAAIGVPPRIAVGCGRQAALATRLLRARGAVSVQILDPRIDPTHWDLVVVPEHDALRGENVITALGSLHPVDDAWLALARGAFPQFEALPRPRTALLLGGGSRHAAFDAGEFAQLADLLDAATTGEGGSVLATTSRRSSQALRVAAKQRYRGPNDVVWCGDESGPNPYPGLLAWADRIVCSPDSVNMVSEACATEVPVFVYAPNAMTGGPARFLDSLLSRGRIRALDRNLPSFDVVPLRETRRVAACIAGRLG